MNRFCVMAALLALPVACAADTPGGNPYFLTVRTAGNVTIGGQLNANQINGAPLSGGFSGAPTFTGNPIFSGTPSFTGNPSFSGNPVFASLSTPGGVIGATGTFGTLTIGSGLNNTLTIASGATAADQATFTQSGTGGVKFLTGNGVLFTQPTGPNGPVRIQSSGIFGLQIGNPAKAPTTMLGGFALATYTVDNLPSCGSANPGEEDLVSDAMSPTYGATVVGGGAVLTPVICDGVSDWKAH